MNLVIVICVCILLVLFVWYISIVNKMKALSIKVKEALSGIDVALSKRYNVLTKMVEVVKGYAKHEKEVLFKVVELRNNMSIEELVDANNTIDENFKKVNLVVENYPDIKANENFIFLQKAFVDVEEHLQAARIIFNYDVSIYNQFVLSYPNVIFAKRNGYLEKSFFQADNLEKESVTIDLEENK